MTTSRTAYLNFKVRHLRKRLDEQRSKAKHIEDAIQRATDKRLRAQRLLEEANIDLAVATTEGRRTRLLTMKEMADMAGYGREHLYTLQRECGLDEDKIAG